MSSRRTSSETDELRALAGDSVEGELDDALERESIESDLEDALASERVESTPIDREPEHTDASEPREAAPEPWLSSDWLRRAAAARGKRLPSEWLKHVESVVRDSWIWERSDASGPTAAPLGHRQTMFSESPVQTTRGSVPERDLRDISLSDLLLARLRLISRPVELVTDLPIDECQSRLAPYVTRHSSALQHNPFMQVGSAGFTLVASEGLLALQGDRYRAAVYGRWSRRDLVTQIRLHIEPKAVIGLAFVFGLCGVLFASLFACVGFASTETFSLLWGLIPLIAVGIILGWWYLLRTLSQDEEAEILRTLVRALEARPARHTPTTGPYRSAPITIRAQDSDEVVQEILADAYHARRRRART